MDKKYVEFIAGLKQNIIQSRYIAAKLANKEQLLLYLKIGNMLSEKIAAEKWGAKVLEQIANDLQKQLPGLKGFSYTNLKNMRQFALEYGHHQFSQSLPGQLQNAQSLPSPTSELPSLPDQSHQTPFGQTLSGQLPETWYNISFTHHMLLISKCKSYKERFSYIDQAATRFWSVRILEHHINSNLYKYQRKVPNNFNNTLPENLKADALQVFRDDYLFDFITLEENDKEKNNTIVEFAVRSIDKAMGVATYRTTKEIPQEMQGILPSPDELAKLL